MKHGLAPLFGLALGLACPGLSYAQSGALPDALPKVVASLVAEHAGVTPGGTVSVALHEKIREHWHTYWVNPGDSGAPTTITWHLPPGWSAGDIQWPYPIRLPVGPLMNFGYEGEVALISDLQAPADAKPGDSVMLEADVNWLVCSDVCIPEETKLSLALSVVATPPPAAPENATLFSATRDKLPKPSPWRAVYDAGDKRFALLVESKELVEARPSEVAFYPLKDGHVEAASPQLLGTTEHGFVIESGTGYKLATADKRANAGLVSLAGLLVLTGSDGRTEALTLEAEPGEVPVGSVTLLATGGGAAGLLQALLFALLGGLILNLMPCVFPVLSMKALALAAKREAPLQAKASALAYGAGVILSFLGLAAALLALRAGGASLGWGFQLQQPMVVTALALLMFAVGLNLSGLYAIGSARLVNLGGSLAGKENAAGSFFTGMLAVAVATPCTAPFMGAALGFALTANAATALAVFAALGVGFAAPFMLLGLWPRALSLLPRPGTWMVVLRQVLAFPMYGAAIWLVWVLSLQAGPDGVLAVLLSALTLSFGLWVYGRSQQANGSRRRAGFGTAAAAMLAAMALVPLAGGGRPPAVAGAGASAEGAIAYEAFSAAKLASLRDEGRPVFINATAAWCITCLVNDRVALSGEKIGTAFSERKIAALKADWTNQDAEITQLLAANGRSGVPLYLYFAPGAAKPVVLPQILTESIVLAALKS